MSFIWGIADDVLRDLFKRGKYPDVILPMCVTRRMDAVLVPTDPVMLEFLGLSGAGKLLESSLEAALIENLLDVAYDTTKDAA